MRLKKAEKEKYLQIIRDSQNKKVVSLQDNSDVDRAWFYLAWDHFQRLRLDLRHVGDIPLMDQLRGDVIADGDPVTLAYLKRYDEKELEIIQYNLDQAERSIRYLQNLIIKVKNDDQAKQKQTSRNAR